MTPPTLDVAMVHARLRTMRELLHDLEAAPRLDVPALQQDRMLRHAVERVLTQLVELAVSVNGHIAVAQLATGASTYRESFDLAVRAGALSADLAERLKPSVGLRNVLVHEYAVVDLDLVARGVALAQTDYRSYVTAVASWLP